MKIKICGLFRDEDVEFVNEALPDYVGFVFAKSRRQVTMEQAGRMRARLDRRIQAVGVFVDADIETVQRAIDEGVIDIAQLHGSESGAYIRQIRAPVIKAHRIGEAIAESADYLLFDSAIAGSGQTFDWSLIPRTGKPFFIAGGINIENIAQAGLLNPFGIDISSGAETMGQKDREKIIEIVRSVRYGKG